MHLVQVGYFFLQNLLFFTLVNIFIWLFINKKIVIIKVTNSIIVIALFITIDLFFHLLVILKSYYNISNYFNRLFVNIFDLF